MTLETSLFLKCTGGLIEFSSTYSVELHYSNVSKTAILTFNQSTQVTHEKENETITPQKYQFQESANTSTSYDTTEKSNILKTYSKKQPVVETMRPISPLASNSICFKRYQMIAGINDLHALTGVKNADFNLLLVCSSNFHPQKMSVEDSFLMFLMKIRHDLPFTALSLHLHCSALMTKQLVGTFI